MKNKEDKAIYDAYRFLSCDAIDYLNNLITKEEFIHELDIVLRNLEIHVPLCDPESIHGNHL